MDLVWIHDNKCILNVSAGGAAPDPAVAVGDRLHLRIRCL